MKFPLKNLTKTRIFLSNLSHFKIFPRPRPSTLHLQSSPCPVPRRVVPTDEDIGTGQAAPSVFYCSDSLSLSGSPTALNNYIQIFNKTLHWWALSCSCQTTMFIAPFQRCIYIHHTMRQKSLIIPPPRTSQHTCSGRIWTFTHFSKPNFFPISSVMPPWLIPGVQLKIGMHTNLCDPLVFYVPPQNDILQLLWWFCWMHLTCQVQIPLQ